MIISRHCCLTLDRLVDLKINEVATVTVVLILILGLVSEEIDFFVLESLAMKLREYTRNTPIRRNPVSKF